MKFNLPQRLQDLLLSGIESGAVRPLTYCTFEKDEVQAAFRYMAAGKHIGKVSSFYYQYVNSWLTLLTRLTYLNFSKIA